MKYSRILTLMLLLVAGIYLLASAPAPLKEDKAIAGGKQIPISRVFDAANSLNATARRIYTKKIVTNGIKSGLKFHEDWRETNIEAGPLPALFLRLIAAQLETKPTRLSLYLGSDKPINASNLFTGKQAEFFQQLKVDSQPRYFEAKNGAKIAMFADFASVQGCVTCHNEHKDSPKKDWKLDDIMGATTWAHPESEVSEQEFLQTIRDLYASINEAYIMYLEKTKGFAVKPPLGEGWPEKGKFLLPSGPVFLQALLNESGPQVTRNLILGEGGS